ncbi:DUF3817 domain-containing protein [Spiractinospora alimapuensis]|uniref:DUF3817 domain-containing protein n=1 Tax=Spiractinospora alimapuensis TaxID=2820884 RepID=UPI001F463A82|nr:DUF3817 domain-containing protein [Spiractinospora alimapuensis]QVQ50327.1 DUF3817 domain-containing protein [Spiractinospora alimapuensis]
MDAKPSSGRAVFLTYQVLAYVTGVLLVLLTFVAMPAKYLIGDDAAFSLVSAPAGTEQLFGAESGLMLPIAMPHGYAYMAYVVVVLWLALSRRWGAGRTLGVALVGTIPVLGMVVERRMARAEAHRSSSVQITGSTAEPAAPTSGS